MSSALYGPDGFYRGRDGPAAHFRTSVSTTTIFADVVAALFALVDRALDRPHPLALVDMGAGRGELLTLLADRLPEPVRLVGVDVVARPPELPARVGWRATLPASLEGLLVANEWLDDVPLDVVEVDAAGAARVVHVEPASGTERLGAPVSAATASWLQRWWPLDGAAGGTRAEVGSTRDAAWADAVSRLHAGMALAIDYSHLLGERPPLGTLTGYRDGRAVAPVPDGSCDVTAHVALDSCAAAVAGGSTGLRSQRDVLHALGVRGELPDRALARTDPGGYLRRVVEASEAAALTARDGLGGFGWLAYVRGMPLPPAFGGSS